jgi:hypothetical protein
MHGWNNDKEGKVHVFRGKMELHFKGSFLSRLYFFGQKENPMVVVQKTKSHNIT